MAVGVKGHLGMGMETTWGTAVTEMDTYLPLVSESLNYNMETYVSNALRGLIDAPAPYQGMSSVGGDIVMEVYPVSIGHILRSAMDDASTVNTVVDHVYTHTFLPRQDDFAAACPLAPYTIEVYRDDSDDEAFQYDGAVVNTLNLSFGVSEQIVRATAGIIAKELTTGIAKTSPDFETSDPFLWHQASVSLASASNTTLEKFSLTLDNHLVSKPVMNGTLVPSLFYRSAARSVELSMEVDFSSMTEYERFKANTSTDLTITLTGEVFYTSAVPTEYSYSLVISIPSFKYTTYPINITGPGLIVSNVTGTAFYDETTEGSIEITLVNDEATYVTPEE